MSIYHVLKVWIFIPVNFVIAKTSLQVPTWWNRTALSSVVPLQSRLRLTEREKLIFAAEWEWFSVKAKSSAWDKWKMQLSVWHSDKNEMQSCHYSKCFLHIFHNVIYIFYILKVSLTTASFWISNSPTNVNSWNPANSEWEREQEINVIMLLASCRLNTLCNGNKPCGLFSNFKYLQLLSWRCPFYPVLAVI